MMFLVWLVSAHALAQPPQVAAKSNLTSLWQNQFRGPEQLLTITACTDKGCHYDFKGLPKAPCTDSGHFTFSNAEHTAATAIHHIGAKNCKYDFTLGDETSAESSIEVDDSCVCNVATDTDMGGEYVRALVSKASTKSN
jgi:hypothetical protein